MDALSSSWPPLPEEVDYHHMKLPKLLKLMMNLLLSKSFPVAERVERMSNSLGEDIIYNMSNGKTKTIKHVQLDITTKRKTGSRLILDSLNYLGHSVSYDEVNNVETSFAELNVKNQSNRLYRTMSVNEDFVSAMTLLGEEDEPSVTVKKTLERLVCSLYQVKLEIDINEARYKFFTKKKKPPPPQSLPRTKDALYLHTERGNYQCQLWKKALDYHPHLPHPVEHGWTGTDGSLVVR